MQGALLLQDAHNADARSQVADGWRTNRSGGDAVNTNTNTDTVDKTTLPPVDNDIKPPEGPTPRPGRRAGGQPASGGQRLRRIAAQAVGAGTVVPQDADPPDMT